MSLRRATDDRQTESAPFDLAAAGGRTPVKALKNALSFRIGNDRGLVGDANLGGGSARKHLDPRATPFGRELDRVVNEVREDLVNQTLIAETLDSVASADVEPYPSGLGWTPKRPNRLIDDFVEIDESAFDSRFGDLRLGEERQVPDESREMDTFACDRSERVAVFRHAAIPGESQFRLAADHSDWRSELVRGVLNKPFHSKKCSVKLLEQLIEDCRQSAKLVGFIGDLKTVRAERSGLQEKPCLSAERVDRPQRPISHDVAAAEREK